MDDLAQYFDTLVEAADWIAEAARTGDAAIVNRKIRDALNLPAPAEVSDPERAVIIAVAAQIDISSTVTEDRLAWTADVPEVARMLRGNLPTLATGVAVAVHGRDHSLIEATISAALATVGEKWKNPVPALIAALGMQVDTFTDAEDRIAWAVDAYDAANPDEDDAADAVSAGDLMEVAA